MNGAGAGVPVERKGVTVSNEWCGGRDVIVEVVTS